MPTVFSVDFSGDGNASAGAAGTTTGAGHGIIDFPGSMLSRVSGQLAMASAGSVYSAHGILPGSGSERDQVIEVLWPGNRPTNGIFRLSLREQGDSPTPSYYRGYSFLWAPQFSLTGINKIDPFNTVESLSLLSFPGYDATTPYIVQFSAVGANPTVLTASLLNAGTRAVLATTTVNDSESILQVNGMASVSAPSVGGGGTPTLLNSITLDEDAGIATLVAGEISVVSRSVGQSVVSVTPSGGTPGYTYQWYRKQDSVNWTPGVGTLISGATSATLTDNAVLPLEIWTYFCKVTDSGVDGDQQIATSDIALVEGFKNESIGSVQAQEVIIVAIGDSITSSGYPTTSMVARLATFGVTAYVSNQGHPGTTLETHWDADTDPAGYVATAVSATETLIAAHPSALVLWLVMLGTNDTANASVYQANMQKLADLCDGEGWTLVINMTPWMALSYQGPAGADTRISYRAAIDAVDAASDAATVGDRHALYEFWLNQDTYFADQIHPNELVGGPALGVLWANALLRGVFRRAGQEFGDAMMLMMH